MPRTEFNVQRCGRLGRYAIAAFARVLAAAVALAPAAAAAATAPGTVITNVAEARWTVGNTPASAQAQHQLSIPPYTLGADLALTKVGPAEASAGDTITWRLVVRNNGTAAASGVQLVDTVPAQVGQLAATCTVLTSGTCGAVSIGTPAPSGTPVTVAIPSLPVGGQVEVAIRGVVAPNATAFSNVASIGYPGLVDPTPNDNTAKVTTQVVPSSNKVASLRGLVWLDVNHDRVRGTSEPVLAGYVVRLYGPDGTAIVAQAKTSADGTYAFAELTPGVAYQLEFRDPAGMTVYGLAVTADGSGTVFAATANCGQKGAATFSGSPLSSNSSGACYSLTSAGSVAQVAQNGRTVITLQPGDTLAGQSRPLDPSGGVFDSATR